MSSGFNPQETGNASNGKYGQTAAQGHSGPAKKKCVCPLYTHQRYDKIDPVKTEAPHYPPNIKTVYTKDYTPKKANQDKYDFSPLKTVQKSQPMRDNYLTTHKKDYTPKEARSTTPIRQGDNTQVGRGVPMKGKTEYHDMTKDTPDQRTYTPVKAQREKRQPVSNFNENTEYNHEYTPKRTMRTTLPPNSAETFKGSAAGPRVGPMDDRTIYRVDYVPKPVDKNGQVDNNTFRGSNWDMRPKNFDGLTIYKKDYVGPEMYFCECPDGASHAGSHH